MRTIILSFFLIPFFLFAAEVKSYDFVVANFPKLIANKGWHNWDKDSNGKTAYFAEYKNKGAGSVSQNRVKWSRLLADRETDSLNFQRVFKDWAPHLTFDR